MEDEPADAAPPAVESAAPELPETVIEADREPEEDEQPPIEVGDAQAPLFNPTEPFGRANDLIGETFSASAGRFGQPELNRRPVLRPGEVLELVPGMVVTQHSGTGKANQFFVRGFNLDHGTDFATFLDGVPLNLPTHAHGQGYLDINFLIPELINYADYQLGPYAANVGDFSSAGSAQLHYFNELPKGISSFTGGSFDYYRALVADSVPLAGGTLLYAYEQTAYNGPWDVSQGYDKYNGVLRWSYGDELAGLAVTGLGMKSDWTATNQVPQRAVDAGLVDRFGSLNATDGGNTTRSILNLEMWKEDGPVTTRANAYASQYGLDLFSDFTFFLDDPVNGDQIYQSDRRVVSGAQVARSLETEFTLHTLGLQFRNDHITRVQLDHTSSRELINPVSSHDVDQQNYGLYYSQEAQLLSWMRSYIGLRGDFFHFDVTSHLDPADSNSVDAAVFSPKSGLIFGPWADSELFVNWGQSFHSNDARGIAAAVDPANPLVKSDGSELGLRSWLTENWQTTFTTWYLELDSELIFVGDAGTTEASAASHRGGLNWTNYLHPTDWLTFDADYAWVRPRFFGGDRIPNSVENVLSAGFTLGRTTGWYSTCRLRHFGPGPLIEDNSARSSTTTLVNLQLGYQGQRWRLACDFLNIFDRKDNDITYYYDNAPPGLPAATDYLFHPVEPFMMRGHLTYNF